MTFTIRYHFRRAQLVFLKFIVRIVFLFLVFDFDPITRHELQ